MKFRIILFLISCLPLIYEFVTLSIIDRQRRKPLPEEVRDVYTKERWKSFVAYKHDSRYTYLLSKAISFLLSTFVIFTPFYQWMERLGQGNVYLLVAVTVVIMETCSLLFSLPVDHYQTFVIENRYGLNKRTEAEFRKDAMVNYVFGMVLAIALYSLLAFILTHVSAWTNHFTIGFWPSFLIMGGIALVLVLFVVGASLVSWYVMRLRYHFVPLEEGELKNKILHLLEGSRKKVRRIEVYDESKKSTSKNAFVLKLPIIRTIGIADNFLNENAEDELLGVLAHEAGHLKHKPSFWNILNRAMLVVLFGAGLLALRSGASIIPLETWLEQQFGLSMMNPVLTFSVLDICTYPLFKLLEVYRNFVSRTEEYEADRNAVKEGFGQPLIRTFKTLSSDELVDVNPADIIEILEYDHPGMAHRIKAINEAESRLA